MTYLRRAFGLTFAALVLMATLNPNAAHITQAQDANTVTVDGSAIVSPVVKAAVEAYTAKNPDAKVEVNVSGTSGGFEKLCAGTLDVNMAVRSITDQEAAACAAKNVKFVELVIGYDALILVVNSASTVACISPDNLNALLSPSASVRNWQEVDPALGNLPISVVYITPAESQAYVLADSIVPGDKLRADVSTSDPADKIAEKVGVDPTAVGLLTVADYSRSVGKQIPLKAVQLKNGASCLDPSQINVEQSRYPASETLYLYVNAASLDREPVTKFLNFTLGSEGRAVVNKADYLPAATTTYDRGLNYIATRQTGRTFSRIETVNVPADTTGSVTVDGSPALFPVIDAVSTAFKPAYDKISITNVGISNDSGYKKLCANNIDLMGATRPPTDAEATACQTANVKTQVVQIGSRAEVLVVNSKNTAAQCLTTDQIAKLFSSDSEGKVKKWSDAGLDFAADLMVITPKYGLAETDLLLSKVVKNVVAPLRRKDTVDNDDPQYRATGTQNVEGAITYLSYADFKKSTAQVTAVKVDAGKGCVEPTDATIKDGTYALTEPLYVVFNLNTFTRPEVKAFVWYLLSDDAVAVFAKQGIVGTDLTAISAARDVALGNFAPDTTTAAATPAATTVATEAATAAATVSATEAATTAATTEAATPVATQAATLAATEAPAVTPAATAAQ